MAKSIIEIEVYNGDKAVASINEIKISLESVSKTARDARKELKKAIDNTTDALIGSAKTLNRERDGWIEVQQSLSTTNAEYRRYQAEIDKIDKKIAKLTDTRKKEEIAIKGSANALKQQIAALKQEQENRARTSGGYQRAQKQIDKLEQQYRELTGAQKGTVAYYDQEIARLRQLQKTQAKTRAEIQKYEKQIASLQLKQNLLTGETKNLSKAKQSYSSSAGAAGASATEFGRIIADLPYGIQGVANNIEQFSQQFVDLTRKSGGFKEGLRSLLDTLKGPAGLVVGVQLLSAGVQMMIKAFRESTKEAEQFNEELLTQGSIFQSLIKTYNDANASLEDRSKVVSALSSTDSQYAKALAEAGNNERKRNEITEKYMQLTSRMNSLNKQRNILTDGYKELLDNEILTEEEINALRQDIYNGDLKSAAGRKKILDDRIGDNNRLKGVLKEVLDITAQMAETQSELDDVLDTSASKVQEYREQLDKLYEDKRLEGFAEGSARINEELRVLREEAGGVFSTLGPDSEEYLAIQVKIEEKLKELRAAQKSEAEERKEEVEEEKERERERLKNLAELNQEYRDKLMEQDDESGIVRLNIAQRDAVAQAKALGASQEEIARIEEYYEGERSKLRIKIAEEEAKEKEKIEDDAQKKKDKALKENEKKLDEYFKKEIDLMKERTNAISDILSGVGQLFEELNNISQARFERQINSLNEERDIIRTNDELTKEEKEKQLTDLQIKENNIQRKRIKSERDMFTLKQAITLAEMIMKQRAMVQEQIMLTQLAATKASLDANDIAVTGVKEIGKAKMSLGTFMSTLGPFGKAAFALSIGGVIASIVSARRKARAEIAGLSDAPISLGGSGSSAANVPTAPDFNVVGASAQSQLLETLGRSQDKPIRAYVVSSEVSTAQEMDRKVVEAASI